LAAPVVDVRFLAPPPGVIDRGPYHLPAGAGPGQEALPACQDIALNTRIRESFLWRLTQHASSFDALSDPGFFCFAGPQALSADFETIPCKRATNNRITAQL
jgi:hypothetical protein